ncbi:MAG: hypothetical protein EXR69_14820 [Myxococcales bacterium]|nr:hypothetical protein [Myxococcales bacterium]
MQRRLAALAVDGRVLVIGAGRASRYAVGRVRGADDSEIATLSAEGREVRDLVRRPVHERTPVGYRRAFLDNYEPNVTPWLPIDIRTRLSEPSRSPLGQPAGNIARLRVRPSQFQRWVGALTADRKAGRGSV